MTDQLPGISIHLHEARINGVFELPAGDMPYISYQGRVMLVLLADAVKCNISDTKDGDTKASWIFKASDAAIVREKGMQEHLSKTLYLDDGFGLDQASLFDEPVDPLEPVDDIEVDEETGEILVERPADPQRSPLFKRVSARMPVDNDVESTNGVGEVESYGQPIKYKDKTLAGFMREEGNE